MKIAFNMPVLWGNLTLRTALKNPPYIIFKIRKARVQKRQSVSEVKL